MIAKMRSCERSDHFVAYELKQQLLSIQIDSSRSACCDNGKFENGLAPLNFLLPPLANKRHTGSSQQPMRFVQFIYSIYIYISLILFVCFLETIQMSELEPIICICMLEVRSCHFGGFSFKDD